MCASAAGCWWTGLPRSDLVSQEIQWPDSLTTRQRLEGRIARLLSGLPGAWLLRVIGEEPVVVDDCRLDAHVQFILAARRRRTQQLLCEPDAVSARGRYRREIQAVAESSGARPTRVKAVRSLQVPGGAGMLEARLYHPPTGDDARRVPLLVFLHGGGFVLGDLDTHDEPCRIICRESGMAVLSIAYRLAPEHTFPAQLDDVHAAMHWVQEHADTLGADPQRVCLGGDSGGANLAIVTTLALAREQRPPAGLLLLYPATNFTADLPSRHTFGQRFILTAPDMDAFAALYTAGDTALWRDERASPALSPDLHLLPPTLITTADFDPLKDEALAFAEALRAEGVTVRTRRARGLTHGYMHMTTIVPAAMSATVEAARAFRSLVADAAAQRA